MLNFDSVPNFFDMDAMLWFRHVQGIQQILFGITLWFVWRAQNESIFKDNNWSTWYSYNQIRTMEHTFFSMIPSSYIAQNPLC